MPDKIDSSVEMLLNMLKDGKMDLDIVPLNFCLILLIFSFDYNSHASRKQGSSELHSEDYHFKDIFKVQQQIGAGCSYETISNVQEQLGQGHCL